MVSTRKKKQSNRRFFCQLDGFDQVVIIGNAVSNRQEKSMVNGGAAEQEFTVGNSDDDQTVNEKVVNVKKLRKVF